MSLFSAPGRTKIINQISILSLGGIAGRQGPSTRAPRDCCQLPPGHMALRPGVSVLGCRALLLIPDRPVKEAAGPEPYQDWVVTREERNMFISWLISAGT